MGTKTVGTSKLFPSFSPKGAGGGPTGGGILSWDGTGDGRAGGALPAPWWAQLPAHVVFVLPSLSGETEAGASQGHPPGVTATGHSLGIPNPQTAHWSLFSPYLAGVGPSPPHQLCGWLVSMGHGCLWTGPQPHIPGGAKGLFVLAHSLPAQPSTHMKLWGHHTFLAPSHLPLPSIAFPKHSWSQAALGTILSRQSRIHAADGA